MLKHLILLLNLLFMFVIKTFVNENIAITPKFPPTVKAGSEFLMEVTISRNNVEGFAKFQHDLPKGFIAKEMESEGASFTFSGQSVKLIWTSLPSENEFKISYKIIVDKDVSGEQSLTGKFSYVVDNVKQTADLPVSTIKVISPEEEKAAAQVQAEQFKKETPAPDTAKASKIEVVITPPSVNCTRQIMPTAVYGEFMVEVTVNKGNIVGFAKLQENIPAGFTAVASKTNNSSFTFSEQKAKFVWVSIPVDQTFSISYTVKADNAAVNGEAAIDGIFSYIENDETKKFILPPNAFTIKSAVEATAAALDNTKTEPAPEANVEKKEMTDTTKAVVKQEEEAPKVVEVPKPESDVTYKVQIAAVHKMVKTSYFKDKHNIIENINTEMHEGWTKYTVGSFKEYKPARDHREEIRTKNIQGPFVTAYNTGKRITVQEALMITSQKWYK